MQTKKEPITLQVDSTCYAVGLPISYYGNKNLVSLARIIDSIPKPSEEQPQADIRIFLNKENARLCAENAYESISPIMFMFEKNKNCTSAVFCLKLKKDVVLKDWGRASMGNQVVDFYLADVTTLGLEQLMTDPESFHISFGGERRLYNIGDLKLQVTEEAKEIEEEGVSCCPMM